MAGRLTVTPHDTTGPLVLRQLAVPEPYDALGVLGFLAARAVAGVEAIGFDGAGSARYARTLRLPSGPGAIELRFSELTPVRWSVEARFELGSAGDEPAALAAVTRLLDLTVDPLAVDEALSADPVLRPRVASTPGIRVAGAVDAHELVVRALVGQQISVAAARTHLGRLAAALGTPYVSAFAGLERVFPDSAAIARGLPEPVAGAEPDPGRPLRLPARGVAGVRDTTRALADGSLVVDPGVEADRLRADLLARPGIGPWTAAYIAMRVIGDRDAWLVGDVALVAGANALGLLDPALARPAAHRALAARAEAWAPWRSYAAMHLWRAATPVTPPRAR